MSCISANDIPPCATHGARLLYDILAPDILSGRYGGQLFLAAQADSAGYSSCGRDHAGADRASGAAAPRSAGAPAGPNIESRPAGTAVSADISSGWRAGVPGDLERAAW